MAQLSDDCFAFGGPLLSVEAAAALIADRVPPLVGEEAVPLRQALGRVLARPLIAPLPLPPFFNSAVDGYAFRHADLGATGATALRLEGRVAAGQAAAALGPGAAVRIFTGAPMPPGADTVVMQEDARLEAEAILVPPGLKPGANARPAGEDVPQGAAALPAGRRLRAPEIGLAAALGVSALPVAPLVRVGVFSTGDELASPGTPLGPAQTHDSNRFTLLALLAGLPVEAIDLGILPDDPVATAAALRAAAASHDLLLTSGGVSTGEEDHVRTAIEQGGRLVFWRLAVKPGRPAAMGVVDGTPVVGLPGNPVAAVVTFLHLARPLVLRLGGAVPEPLPRFAARAGFGYRKKAGRREYVRVRLEAGLPLPVARKFERDGAGLLSSLTESDAFAELDEAVLTVAPGDTVAVLPFAALF
ncbi:molybdopterin molybdenumtransferase MoeA [Siccirubricoccus deserti]|uniref:Molybdopterin molybdenumtransferase n=1 Tax=Siccirubricoccus deserti TaxID=2013562 RepID=A0A9X0QWT3_9PROT|nr:gephyrin-like molybdotransferase Glp [Siccirubricoccus deserti]MBC4015274.1 molybdopterin molybdotransferase MoeA [Siccirubricoccus deserti]GGC37541.1 molybdopterin molybdenumtransferase MoeA [Siccirubricoccus deserti]